MSSQVIQPTEYDIIWSIVNKARCYKTLQHQHLIEVDINNRHELLQIGSEAFKNWVIYKLSSLGHKINAEGMANIISRLNAKVWAIDKKIEVHSRIARSSKAIYYNLGNKNGEIVRVTPNGYSFVPSKNCIVKFINSNNMKEQCKPRRDKDIGIFDLQKYLNIKSPETLRLLLIYIVSCFIPKIAHPILITTGSHGAAKTTSNVLIKKLVDPALADIISLPRDKRDLFVQLNKGYMLFYDNIKKINPEFNDVFCQASTGGYQIARKLYTDDDIVTYKLQRCLLLNGIGNLTDQPDLLDRAISIRYERIGETVRMTEQELYTNFNQDLPYFLNDIFNIVSGAMKIIDSVKLDNLPRMADFARWGYAIAEVMGIGGGNFIKYYKANQLGLGLELIESNTTAMTIIGFMKREKVWKGSVKAFWELINDFAMRKNINRNDQTWAKNENSLSRRMTEIKVNLEEQGVFFTKKNVGHYKELHICYEKPHSVAKKA